MNKSNAISITNTAIKLIVSLILVGLEPLFVKADATWPITKEIDGKIPPADTAASVPPINRK